MARVSIFKLFIQEMSAVRLWSFSLLYWSSWTLNALLSGTLIVPNKHFYTFSWNLLGIVNFS